MSSPRFSRQASAAILLLLVLSAAALVWMRQPSRQAPPAAASAPPSRALLLTGLIDHSLQRVATVSHTPPSAPARPPELAVMPFDAPAGDETLAALAEALCDAVLERLHRDEAPPASACNSARVAAQVGMSPAEVGRLLGVRSLLGGSLSRQDGQLRLQARLVAVADGREHWLHDALIAPDQVQQLPLQLVDRIMGRSPPPAAAASAAPAAPDVHTPPAAAYAAYLRALHLRRSGGHDNLVEARRLLDQALALAPDYPPAIVASIGLNSNLVALGMGSGAAVDAQVRQAAHQLQRVDPDGPQAAMVGSSAAVGQRRWADALLLLQRAAARHPQHAPLRHTQAGILMMMGYVRQGQAVARQVALLEPLNGSSHERLARAWSLLGDQARLHESAVLARELGWGAQVGSFFGLHALRQGDAAAAERHWVEGLSAARMPHD
jgi:TolB-like protein